MRLKAKPSSLYLKLYLCFHAGTRYRTSKRILSCLQPTIPHLLMNSFDKFKCLYHKLRTSGAQISNHGFAGPLKWITAADSSIYLLTCGERCPNPAICQEELMGWTWPSNANNAGGSAPGCHNVKPEFRLCKYNKRVISQLLNLVLVLWLKYLVMGYSNLN